MIKLAFDGPKILWAGYAAFAAFFIIWPSVYLGVSDELSAKRIGSADGFTIIVTHTLLIISFWTVFWLKSVDAVITAHSIRAWVIGVMLESAGWILQRMFWVPWYAYKELGDAGWPQVPGYLEGNVWLLTLPYVVIWVGCGLSMNIVFRTLMRDHYHWWPLAWLSVVISSWIIGYNIPDLFRVLHG